MVRIALALLLLVLVPSTAIAAERVALVIGNAAYQHTSKLANTINDAKDMGTTLKKLGFQVVEGFDLDKGAMDRKIREFAAALEDAQAGVFFYSGHGLQVAGQNYIVPIDAELTTVAALELEMVRLDVVHRIMEQLTTTNILILDACRNNPLARNLAKAMGRRSVEIGDGLAVAQAGLGTLIAFSTQPGNVAWDGKGRNSPFSGPLVKHIAASTDDLNSILIAVRTDVVKETQGRQVPWEHSALMGRFYFKPPAPTAPPATPSKEAKPATPEKETKEKTDANARADKGAREKAAKVEPPKSKEAPNTDQPRKDRGTQKTSGVGWVAAQGFRTCSDVRSSCQKHPRPVYGACDSRYRSCLSDGCWRTIAEGQVCGLQQR